MCLVIINGLEGAGDIGYIEVRFIFVFLSYPMCGSLAEDWGSLLDSNGSTPEDLCLTWVRLLPFPHNIKIIKC